MNMVKRINEHHIPIGNIETSKSCIFYSNDVVKFICVPIKSNTDSDIRHFFNKLLSAVHCKDPRFNAFAKSLKRQKDDGEVCACVSEFLSNNSDYMHCAGAYSQSTVLDDDRAETTLLGERNGFELSDGEVNTTLLSEETNNFRFGEEAETTILNKQSNTVFSEGESETTLLNSNNGAFGADGNKMSAGTDYRYNLGNDMGESETTVLTPPENRTFDAAERTNGFTGKLFLIRNTTGERIDIPYTPFRIGKDPLSMDYVLVNNTVSRNHATVNYCQGIFVIEDNGSTNGTAVEGIRLDRYGRAEIENGFIVSLGSESLSVHIERG